ncbi:hypothetical protein MML48_6g00015826 [Holotrichia oblita]|uniref:Uncharacterized protein n=1 Tax=Holotrichia oblita TaxID=644536 RepID=A0ACB9SZG5_HOLOL|nr:hypothetical protein MML48_6g00015826 [Holotrichia oblita]
MYNSLDPQAIYLCPYDSAHRILNYRMATHLVKCRKNHGASAMAVCIFNANHSIPEMELQYHQENCPDRFNLDKQVLISKDVDHSRFPIQAHEVESEENWDDVRIVIMYHFKENHPSYQPEEYCKSKAIMRQAKVESAATRRNFRVEERHRFQQLKDVGPSSSVSLELSKQNVLGNQKVPENRAMPSKFRTTALANTTTNVEENSPYPFEDRHKINESKPPKDIIADPNYNPIFVRTAKPVNERTENCQPVQLEEARAIQPSEPRTDYAASDNDGFVMQRKRRGRGRGRGLHH